MHRRWRFYEFFAGGGMVRAGLGPQWECLFANDIDARKAAAYEANWGGQELLVGDVRRVAAEVVPDTADLAWASFPCQDLSLAGSGRGLAGARSGTFWAFWALLQELRGSGRQPRLVAIENVVGLLSSAGGQDFAQVCGCFAEAGYRVGAVVVDARMFVPQSRPRLFIIAAAPGVAVPPHTEAAADSVDPKWFPPALRSAVHALPASVADRWVWWRVPVPTTKPPRLREIIEAEPRGVQWHTQEETQRILAMMAPAHLKRVEEAQRAGHEVVGTVYRRTRQDDEGTKIQRTEVRFDDVAGCLRTPVGGSSRQTVLLVTETSIRSRLLSPREAARLMGLPETYKLPESYNEAYHLVGDGVVVPVVRHLASSVFEPLLASTPREMADGGSVERAYA